MRLSKYLKDKYSDFSNKEIKRAVENGACIINGKVEIFTSREIKPQKDKIVFKEQKFKAQEKLIIKKTHIVYEDDDLLVYDKEAGHACMATESKKTNLHSELKAQLKLKFIEPAHRLDKDTSGLIIFCKNKKALNKMIQSFKDKEVQKTYLAVVDKKWSKAKTGAIKNYLELDYKKAGKQKWKVSKVKKETAEANKRKFKHSETSYKVLKVNKEKSLVELEPKTGRTHQLRIHLANLGHPILGDNLYAERFSSKELYVRHLLHAQKLTFYHPISSKKLNLKTKLPKEFEFSTE